MRRFAADSANQRHPLRNLPLGHDLPLQRRLGQVAGGPRRRPGVDGRGQFLPIARFVETLRKTLLQTGPSGQHRVLLHPRQGLLSHESARVLRGVPPQESGRVDDLRRCGQKAYFWQENAESRCFGRHDE